MGKKASLQGPSVSRSSVPLEEQYELRLGEALARRRSPARAGGPSRRPTRVGAELTPGPARLLASKAGIWVLPPEATASDAFYRILDHCRAHIVANVPAVTQSREPEGVHQLRVALRRLRVALVAFGPDFRTPSLEALRMRAKLLAAGLGPARDMDVFLGELLAPAQADASLQPAFAELRQRAEARRDTAWQAAVHTVASLAFHNFLRDLTQAIEQRVWYEPVAEGGNGERLLRFDLPARELADHQLAHCFRKARKRARKLQNLDESQRHRLRIALKKLRYTLEFFASLYDAKAVKPFVRRLSLMQDVLGGLQDLAVARRILEEIVDAPFGAPEGAQSNLSFAAGTVYGWHLERASTSWKDAKLRWKRLVKTDTFWSPS